MFCPNCGNDVGVLAPVVPQEPMEVTLARIESERAIEVARIEASATRAELRTAETIAETEAGAQVESATAVAAILTAEDEPAPEPEPEPLVIEAPAPEPEPEPDNSPPPVEHHEPRAKSGGWWDAYR